MNAFGVNPDMFTFNAFVSAYEKVTAQLTWLLDLCLWKSRECRRSFEGVWWDKSFWGETGCHHVQRLRLCLWKSRKATRIYASVWRVEYFWGEAQCRHLQLFDLCLWKNRKGRRRLRIFRSPMSTLLMPWSLLVEKQERWEKLCGCWMKWMLFGWSPLSSPVVSWSYMYL